MMKVPRSLALGLVIVVLCAACASGNSTSGAGSGLAADQTFRWPLITDVATLDPGHASSGTDINIIQNLFDGLYRFDDQLNITNDVATGPPEISSDGLRYTFHLRHNVKFSNGDPVKASDFLYSWNRAASLQDAYASVFDTVVGYDAVAAGTAKTLSGLSSPDDYTINAVLSHPAGYWLSEMALWTADVVDQKIIEAKGTDTWWTTPDGLIGTGPFLMTERTPKVSMAFAPVPNWWGGSTGALKKVQLQVVADQASMVQKFEVGGFDVIGPSENGPDNEDILRYHSDPTKQKLLQIFPGARTDWIGFNFIKGPFAGADGLNGRVAFSEAIDRNQIVDVACAKGLTCSAATGGYISKGLQGYNPDGGQAAKFDPVAAKALYQKWDPTGSKVQGLTYWYNSDSQLKAVAENLQSQWKQNLGVTVNLATADKPAFFKMRMQKQLIIYRDSFGADYNNPQDWFDSDWTCVKAKLTTSGNSGGYCNPQVDALVQKANTQPLDQALPLYVQADALMIQDESYASLFYYNWPWFIQPYVSGAGKNALYDFRWTGTKILKH